MLISNLSADPEKAFTGGTVCNMLTPGLEGTFFPAKTRKWISGIAFYREIEYFRKKVQTSGWYFDIIAINERGGSIVRFTLGPFYVFEPCRSVG